MYASSYQIFDENVFHNEDMSRVEYPNGSTDEWITSMNVWNISHMFYIENIALAYVLFDVEQEIKCAQKFWDINHTSMVLDPMNGHDEHELLSRAMWKSIFHNHDIYMTRFLRYLVLRPLLLRLLLLRFFPIYHLFLTRIDLKRMKKISCYNIAHRRDISDVQLKKNFLVQILSNILPCLTGYISVSLFRSIAFSMQKHCFSEPIRKDWRHDEYANKYQRMCVAWKEVHLYLNICLHSIGGEREREREREQNLVQGERERRERNFVLVLDVFLFDNKNSSWSLDDLYSSSPFSLLFPRKPKYEAFFSYYYEKQLAINFDCLLIIYSVWLSIKWLIVIIYSLKEKKYISRYSVHPCPITATYFFLSPRLFNTYIDILSLTSSQHKTRWKFC